MAQAIQQPQETIAMSQVVDLADAKLKAIAKRALRSLQLEAEKAIANVADPAAFPRTAPSESALARGGTSSAEDVFAAWFNKLSPVKKEAAMTRVMASVKASAQEREAVYGDLARVDLRSAAPASDQAMRLPLPEDLRLSVEYVNSLTKFEGQIIKACPLQFSPEGEIDAETGFSPVTNKLEFRIHKVTCVDETDPEFFGDDEISLGGTTVDQSGVTRKVNAFQVRPDFDDNEAQTYSPPKRFTSFELTAGTTFPKTYVVTLVLAETDMGGITDFINMLWEKAKGQVLAWITAAVGGAIGSATIPLLGTIIGSAVGYIVGLLVNWLIGLLGDDVFPPFTTSITIPSLSHRFNGMTDSPNAATLFTGYGGKYQLTFDWRLFA